MKKDYEINEERIKQIKSNVCFHKRSRLLASVKKVELDASDLIILHQSAEHLITVIEKIKNKAKREFVFELFRGMIETVIVMNAENISVEEAIKQTIKRG